VTNWWTLFVANRKRLRPEAIGIAMRFLIVSIHVVQESWEVESAAADLLLLLESRRI
jgi:hypothetical protein